MGRIDLETVPQKTGSIYPAPYGAEMAGRRSLRLGEAGGLTQFGANLVILEPGAKSSLRHWHRSEDEFVMITEGTCTLVDNAGEHRMHPGDCAAFPAGEENGHHFINKSGSEARFLVIGTRASSEVATYSDIDMMVQLDATGFRFTRKNGEPLAEDSQ
jgi:uncharacterized cupin superfamily protein